MIVIVQLNYGSVIAENCSKVSAEYRKAAEQGADIVLFSRYAISGYIDKLPVLPGEFAEQCRKHVQSLALCTLKQSSCAIVGGVEIGKDNELREVIYLLSSGTYEALHPSPQGYYVIHSGGVQVILALEESVLAKIKKENITKSTLLVLMEKRISPETSFMYRDLIEPGVTFACVNLLGGYKGSVFPGGSFIYDNSGISQCPMWREAVTSSGTYTAYSKVTSDTEFLYRSLMLAIRDYVHKNGFSGVVLGMSGGVDSALVATIATDALGGNNVHTFMLATRYTSQISKDDAQQCADNLCTNHGVIDIEDTFYSTLRGLQCLPQGQDSMEENIQSRIRGVFLMAASNRKRLLLLATGNRSELLTGYMTLYGDTCGGFAPIKDIYKTKVYELAEWRNKNIPEGSLCNRTSVIPERIISKPPSAELRPGQQDQDTLPEYAELDHILHLLVDKQESVESAKLLCAPDKVDLVESMVSRSCFKLEQTACGPTFPYYLKYSPSGLHGKEKGSCT